MDAEARLEALESRLLFLEDAQPKLDAALSDQQQQLLDLQRAIGLLTDRLQDVESARPEGPEPPPPHY